MKKLYFAVLSLFFGLLSAKSESSMNGKSTRFGTVVGSVVSLNVEFDMYKVREGSIRRPSYYYMIMPAPEPGLGGRFITYLGRMPSGTRLEIVSVNIDGPRKMSYWLKLIAPLSSSIKGNVNRKIEAAEEPLDEQPFAIYSIASNVGIYEKGKQYSSGEPRLSETWFSLVKLNE